MKGVEEDLKLSSGLGFEIDGSIFGKNQECPEFVYRENNRV